MADERQSGVAADTAKDVEQLRVEVEQARERLAGTVEELGGRVDPRPRIEQAKVRAQATGRDVATYAAPAAVGLAALAAIVIWRRRS